MIDTSQIISIVLVLSPIIAAIPPLTTVFDLSYRDAKKRFEEIGKVLKERKIENWRSVFLGANADGINISVNDEYVERVLGAISEEGVLYKFLCLCKRSFNVYYGLLLAIFCLGVTHGFFDLMNWLPGVIEYINGYKTPIIAGTLLYVVVGMIWLFWSKYRLEKKYEKYVGI